MAAQTPLDRRDEQLALLVRELEVIRACAEPSVQGRLIDELLEQLHEEVDAPLTPVTSL